MSKLKLSPWHEGGVKPVRVGWYQVKGVFNPGKYGKVKDFSAWRKWDGQKWLWVTDAGDLTLAGIWHSDKWRGVLK